MFILKIISKKLTFQIRVNLFIYDFGLNERSKECFQSSVQEVVALVIKN